MIRNFTIIMMSLWLCWACLPAQGQTYPSVSPSATFTDADGNTEEGQSFQGSAPVRLALAMHPADDAGWDAHYEWRFYEEDGTEPYIVRYEEETSLTLTETGNYTIVAYARFTHAGLDYEIDLGDNPFTVSVSESQLYMPNAFSPNGDGINDIYRAKPGYRSIVEFHATIFNRWGKKLYEWNDPADGWDGTYQGKDVKQGVYFVLVKARGADGREYVIKRDVNLLRGYTEDTSVE